MSVGRNTLGTFATNTFNLLLSFGNSILLTRTLGVVGRGEFAVFAASVGILSLLLGLGLENAVRYFLARDRIPRERILASFLLQVALVGAVVFAGARLNHLFFDNELFLPAGRQTMAFELVLAGTVAATLFHGTLSSVFAGLRSFRTINLASVGLNVLALVVYGGLFWADTVGGGSIGSAEIFQAYLALQVVHALLLTVLAWWLLGVRLSWAWLKPGLLVEMVRYAGKAFLAQVAQFLNYRVDIWIVQMLAGVGPLGLYSLAANLAMTFWVLPRSVARVLMPSVAAEDPGTSAQDVARMARLSLMATVSVGVGAGVTAPFWMGLLYGTEFSDAAVPFGILLVGCVPFTLSVVIGATLNGLNRLEENLAASLAGLAVTLVLDLLLIPRYGILGAAAASSASYLVTTVMVVRAYARIASISGRHLVLPRFEDLRYVRNGLRDLLR